MNYAGQVQEIAMVSTQTGTNDHKNEADFHQPSQVVVPSVHNYEDDGLDATASLGPTEASASSHEDTMDRHAQLRREKRLAMNRESARARRRRKKVLLSTLEEQVEALEKTSEQYHRDNEALVSRVSQLEAQLCAARSTITALNSCVAQQEHSRPKMMAPLISAHQLNGLSGVSSSHHDVNLQKLLLAQSQSLSKQGAPIIAIPLLESTLLQQRFLERGQITQSGSRENATLENLFAAHRSQAPSGNVYLRNPAAIATRLAMAS